jgi:hypothetical protein
MSEHSSAFLDGDAGQAEAITEVRREAALLKTGALQNAIFNSANFSSIATILARHGSEAFHVLFATDLEGDNVRVVTSYRPDPGEWQADLKARRPN